MSNKIVNLTEQEFDQFVASAQLPVLVDFWAPWCGPCKTIAPLLDELAEELSDVLIIAKVNVDENAALPKKLGVRGIPTMLVFKNGTLQATKVGAATKAALTMFVGAHI
jgi:thioredoxin 1